MDFIFRPVNPDLRASPAWLESLILPPRRRPANNVKGEFLWNVDGVARSAIHRQSFFNRLLMNKSVMSVFSVLANGGSYSDALNLNPG